MGKTLYLECNAGISGDMTVGALLDLGADEQVLRNAINSIPASGFDIKISRVIKSGVDCQDFDVILDKDHENHDHDMDYLHGDEHDHHHEEQCQEHAHHHEEEAHNHEEQCQEHHHHHHEEEAHNHEEQCQEHHHHHHLHVHTNLQQVVDIIEKTDISNKAKETAVNIFQIIAEAEAKAHNKPISEVHFHEVGAVDSIVDIISVSVLLDNLHIDKVIVGPLHEGSGTVRCQHGVLPVPVPAVANICAAHSISMSFSNVKGEFVTPTGAAIVAAIKTEDTLPESFTIDKVGMGAGKRTYEIPSILRAMLITAKPQNHDKIYKLETNIDDCTGENLGYVMDMLINEGARDVHYHPVFMKKNRPGWQLNVICKEEQIDKLEKIIFAETTTIGIRRLEMERSVLPRKIVQVDTAYGKARVKLCKRDNYVETYPEYEDVAAIAKRDGLTFSQVYDEIKRAGSKLDF